MGAKKGEEKKIQEFFSFINEYFRKYNNDYFLFSPQNINIYLHFTKGEFGKEADIDENIRKIFIPNSHENRITLPFSYNNLEKKIGEIIEKIPEIFKYGYSFFIETRKLIFNEKNQIYTMTIHNLDRQTEQLIDVNINHHKLYNIYAYMDITLSKLEQIGNILISIDGHLEIFVSYELMNIL